MCLTCEPLFSYTTQSQISLIISLAIEWIAAGLNLPQGSATLFYDLLFTHVRIFQPYAFHQVMRSLFIPLRMATDARELTLVTDLDRNIDIVCSTFFCFRLNLDSTSLNQIARKVAYEALGENKETIREHIKKYPDFDGVVVGDETRLRQIITNLARYEFWLSLVGNCCR